MKEKATIPYEQLIDTIEKFSNGYTEFRCLTDEVQIKGYTLRLALHLSAKFYFDKKKEESELYGT